MPLSLDFHTDTGLTTLAADNIQIDHLVDGSNDPQDFVYYLGSTVSANKFEANSDPGVDQITVSIVNATPLWLANNVTALNDLGRTTAKNGYQYKATDIGSAPNQTAGAEPAWPTVIGNTVVDGDITWTCIGKLHESTEIKLATSNAGLDAAVAGDPLDLGTSIVGGAANNVEVHVRIDDATATIGDMDELDLQLNEIKESVI